MKRLKEYLNVEIVMTSLILVFVIVLAADGFFVKKLSSSAMAFPGFVFIAAIVIGLLEIGGNIRSVNKRLRTSENEGNSNQKKPVLDNKKNFIAMCMMLAVYFLLLYLIGFIISSIVFSLMFAIYHRYQRMVLFTGVTVMIVVFWFILFSKFLGVNIPNGLLAEVLFG